MYPQGACRIRKPAYAGNGCAIFPVFDTEEWTKKKRGSMSIVGVETKQEMIDRVGEKSSGTILL